MNGPIRALIVGGSLAGLGSALALARQGLEVTVLERAARASRVGGAVGVDPAHLRRVTGVGGWDGRDGHTAEPWQGLRARLLRAVEQHDNVAVHHETAADEVGQDDSGAWVKAADRTFRGDVVIGADGHRSIVRAAVAPQHPHAEFAGYVLWIGVADEDKLPAMRRWPAAPEILNGGDAMLIGYPLDSADDGRTATRRLGWAWFDAGHNTLLHETGAVRNGVVRHSLRPSSIPQSVIRELRTESSLWAQPWRAAIEDSLDRHAVTGVPIAEYIPDRLASGRMALVGNAAHVPTPMTGKGFDASLDDAAALARVLGRTEAADIPAALADYEAARLHDAAAMVRGGQAFSRSFGRR